MLFECIIRGENFPGSIIGETGSIGFYSRRQIEAESPEQAELLTLEQLRQDPIFAVLAEDENEEAAVFFEEVRPAAMTDADESEAGFIWFPMEDSATTAKASAQI